MELEVILDTQPKIEVSLDDIIINVGVDLSSATATANDVLLNKTFFAQNSQLKSGTIPSLQETIYEPSETERIIQAGNYLQGNQTIKAVSLGEKTINTNGTYVASDENYMGYKTVTVNVQPPMPVEEKDINFYDYDGSLLYSWTLNELALSTSMPNSPTHEGLISQGWNWSLSDLKSQNTKMNVGQLYTTDDGKTRLYISVSNNSGLDIPIYFYQSIGSGVKIDWGDGSEVQTINGVGYVNTTHTYPSLGEYVITLNITSGNARLGSNITNRSMFYIKPAVLNKVEIGNNISLNSYCFYYCTNLQAITIKSDLSLSATYGFAYCLNLKHIVFPTAYDRIDKLSVFLNCYSLKTVCFTRTFRYFYGDSAFDGCASLKNIYLSKILVTLGAYSFRGNSLLEEVNLNDLTSCSSIPTSCFFNDSKLTKITILSNVTSLRAGCFSGCYGIKEYHFKRTTPPSIDSTNVFTGLAIDCIMYVPVGSLTAYQTATNWSSFASYMREEI
jgi:hypothetical protein